MNATESRPRRLTLSDILEMMLSRDRASHPSVSLTRTASGDVVIDVKASGDTLTEASALAEAEFDRLREKYPSAGESQPAVSLSRNAKGDTQVEVKGIGWATVKDTYDTARMKYPMANGHTARPGSVA